MKKNIYTAFCSIAIVIFTFIPLQVMAQGGNKIFLQVQYEVTGLEYLDKHAYRDLFNLDIGDSGSIYYSYTEYCRDSVIRDLKSQGYTGFSLRNTLEEKGFRQGVKITVAIKDNKQEINTYDKIGISNFFYSEPKTEIKWEVTSDTSMIFGYKCLKARATYKGRGWIAWFSPDIPISRGPWKLYGLPGLILKANDMENHYSFECVGLSKFTGFIDLSGYSQYKKIEKGEFDKLLLKYKCNPLDFSENQSGVSIGIIKDNSGRTIKRSNYQNLQYNPIER